MDYFIFVPFLYTNEIYLLLTVLILIKNEQQTT